MNTEKVVPLVEPFRVVNNYPHDERQPTSSKDLKRVELLHFNNTARYMAQSALSGLIEDRYYVPTLAEAEVILTWANRRARP